MKTLDWYILRQFLWNYLIFLVVIIGMYIVFDMVFQFDKVVGSGEGVEHRNVLATVADVADYYFYQCFSIFTQMSGIIPVVAAAFTLLRLSRFNELTAAVAAGVPMLRLAVPIVAAAVGLNLLLVADQELVLPRMIPKLTRRHEDIHKSAGRSYQITPMPVGDHTELLAAAYDPGTRLMADVDVVERDTADRPVRHVWADGAAWDQADGTWHLTRGRFTTGIQPDQTISAPQTQAAYVGVTPDEIALFHDRKSGLVDLLSTRRLNELIAQPKGYAAGVGGLYRIKYLRLAQPFMNVVLVLLTIPAVLSFDPKSLKPAATRCLTLTGLAMGSVFICQQMAGQPPVSGAWSAGSWPALMSWVPIFIWLPVAVLLLERVRT